FMNGQPIDDPAVCDGIVDRAGADAAHIRAAVESGAIDPYLRDSHCAALEAGGSSTPTWVLGDLMIPGALDETTLRRWLGRLASRTRDSFSPRWSRGSSWLLSSSPRPSWRGPSSSRISSPRPS